MKSLYFFAILPPIELQDTITDFKLTAKKKFNSSRALNSSPHITLIPPFWYYDNEIDHIKNTLIQFNLNLQSFFIKLDGFNSFPPKVIYIDVEDSLVLDRCYADLNEAFEKHIYIDTKPKHRFGFKPHMTIAFKDLSREIFSDAWDYYKSLEYQASFLVEEVSLLKFNDKKWQIV